MIKECLSRKELYSENLELKEALKQATQFNTGDKVQDNGINHDEDAENMIVDFEFCEPYWKVSDYVRSFFQFGNNTKVWFSGKVNTRTGKVLSSKYGKIGQG